MDALLALLEEGHVRPSAEKVAERAGVSRRALFNHFTDLEDLLRHAAARRFQAVSALIPTPSREGSRQTRLRELCTGMGHFHEKIAPVRRAGILFASESQIVAAHMREAARMHRGLVEHAFSAELAKLSEDERRVALAGLAAALSFSTWEELRHTQGLEFDDALRATMRLAAGALSQEKERAREK